MRRKMLAVFLSVRVTRPRQDTMMGLLLGIMVVAGVGAVWADEAFERATLRGITGFVVIVEPLKSEVERHGLSTQQLQTDVELRLRQSGIPVLTREEGKQKGVPSLSVQVGILLAPLCSFHVTIEVYQLVYLRDHTTLTSASTWRVSSFGTIGISNLTSLRQTVRDHVDEFINAYLSVNPGPASSAPLAAPTASPRQVLIRQAQERLQAAGFQPGAIDGAMGPQTRSALQWFQNTKGLLPTGELDGKTLDALGVR